MELQNICRCIGRLLTRYCRPSGPKTKLSTGKTVTNLATYNYYNLSGNEEIKQSAINTLRTYGVGPCGPPNFYGTQDVHIKVESDIATHLGTEACIIYAHNTSTIPSVMSSFAKRGDILVADRACNKQIYEGLDLSRSTVKFYEHNDMEDLERVLKDTFDDENRRGTAEKNRRFIITEGLFEYSGDMVDFSKVYELGKKYNFRFILDETWSYGVLGRTGRGITEHQNVDPKLIHMIVGSPAGPLCGGGGFCAGQKDIVEHQRIAAPAYTFSAALPAMHATTASATLAMLQSKPDILATSRENTKTMRAQLDPRSDWVTVTSSPENPCIIVVLKPEVINSRRLSHEDQERVLQECVDEALNNGVLITRLKTMPSSVGSGKQRPLPQPALKICVTTGLSKKEIEKSGTTIRHAITKVMQRRSKTLGVPLIG